MDKLMNAELSALVAEKVMGASRTSTCRFATDDGLALRAALRVSGQRTIPQMVEITAKNDGEWLARAGSHCAFGTTVARALCFAALRAVGEEVEDDG